MMITQSSDLSGSSDEGVYDLFIPGIPVLCIYACLIYSGIVIYLQVVGWLRGGSLD